MPVRRTDLAVAATLFVLLGSGCGSDTKSTQGLDLGGVDANQIGVLIDDINEAKGNAKKAAVLFAQGVKAPDPKKLNLYDYSLADKPAVSGNTATCKIRIDSSTGGPKGEQEWTFVKEGDTWKVKSAPLP